MPLVSIITPTFGRARFLPALARCVAQQQQVDWEWLVLDDSPAPNDWMREQGARDPRIRYRHSPARLTIGAKRGQLVAMARGDLIAHFDDDDYYAPHYLADMARLLTERHADLVKLSAFFLYAPQAGLLGYMDLNAPDGPQYMPVAAKVSAVDPHDVMPIGDDFVLCYGFSYVYRRALAAAAQFADVDLGEDDNFIRAVVAAGHRVETVDDVRQSCLHVVHPNSTSRCFARYRLPAFLLPQLFPGYAGYPG
ncbi:MAG: glycosyltransferase family 2 protein [Rhodanobacteraceae bacterium]|nr:MAG: glycosyltransferase family 2 protein [Rhodanobacteraceae bacterium]